MNAKREVLQIKKYPNRRYYDATRSSHITLHEVYDLIQAGHDVVISDSRTGEDITNLILAQVILERDQPKLDVFPSSILHIMIRSNRHMLRSFVDRFFGPMMEVFATSQRQWETYLRDAMSGRIASPLDWANSLFNAFGANRRHAATDSAPPESPGDNREPPVPPEPTRDTLQDLRDQVAELTRRIEAATTKETRPPTDDRQYAEGSQNPMASD